MSSYTDLQKKYSQQFLQEFKLQDATPEIQQKILAMVSERMLDVAVVTAIKMMNEDQRARFMLAIADPDKHEDQLSSLAAEIPGLQVATEQAFLEEYETLKDNFVV